MKLPTLFLTKLKFIGTFEPVHMLATVQAIGLFLFTVGVFWFFGSRISFNLSVVNSSPRSAAFFCPVNYVLCVKAKKIRSQLSFAKFIA